MAFEFLIGLSGIAVAGAAAAGYALTKEKKQTAGLREQLDNLQQAQSADAVKISDLEADAARLTDEIAKERGAVINNIPIPVCVFDRDGAFKLGNDALNQWNAGEGEDQEPAQASDKFVLRLKLALNKHLANMDLKDPRWDLLVDEFALTKKNGEVTNTVVQYVRPNASDDVVWLLLIDGTQLASDELPAFVQRAPIGFAILDQSKKVIDCNAAFSAIFDESNRRKAVSVFEAFVKGSDGGVVNTLIDDAIGGGAESGLIEVRIPDEEDRFVSVMARPISDDRTRIALYMIDISEQKSLETQFVQSQKMQAIGQLAGGLAHDFNNLLTAMTGFCDLLLLRHRPGDQSFADIMQIKQNANRAANLVRQLLAFSRQQTLIPRVLDITDTLADLFHLLKRLIGENIELNMVHGREPHPVRVDQSQLEQVIINLVVNARDAMTEGGKITMHTANMSTAKPMRQGDQIMPPGDYLLIEVIDTGSGIPQENLERIFDPFFTTKSVGSGTGLGLATVYGIVHQTDGYIFVDSTVDVGTTFSIYLPAYEGDRSDLEREEETRDGMASADLTGYGGILLVEDEDPVRLFAARALRGKGYDVLEARSGEAALELLENETQPIDLLITDVVMPGIDGPTLVAKVREQMPGIRVICISGYSEDALRQRISEDTDIQFLSKPFSLDQLAGKVKEVMKRSDSEPRATVVGASTD